MKKKLFIILLIFLLTGCYDHKELNTISILTATEINKIDDNYIIHAQIVNPQAPDKSIPIQAPFIIYEGTGKTIQEAYRQIKLQSARYLYATHLEIIIINEQLAKQDVTDIIDFYLRTPSTRTEFNVLIGKNNNILSTITPIDQISASSIDKSLKTSQDLIGISTQVPFSKFTEMSLNPNTEIILPSVELINSNKEQDNIKNTESTIVNSMYKISTLAVFKNNKLQGYLTKDESITYNFIKNNIKNSIITYECDKNKYISLEILDNKTKITTKNKNININIDINTTINESACKINLSNNKKLNKLTKKIEKQLNNDISNNIDTIRNNYNSDIFGFLDIIYKYDYNTYKKIKDNWYKDEFKNININVKTNINISSKGNILEGNNEKD